MIAVPHMGKVHTKFMISILQIMDYCREWNSKNEEKILCDIRFQKGTVISYQRTMLVKDFLENKEYTHLLFLDSDMSFPNDVIVKLLEHNKDVCCGTYRNRQDTHYTTYLILPDQKELVPVLGIDKGDGLQEVLANGTGCMLIKREVLEKVNQFRFEGEKGEDINFCSDVRKEGFKIYTDLSLQCSHYIIQEVK